MFVPLVFKAFATCQVATQTTTEGLKQPLIPYSELFLGGRYLSCLGRKVSSLEAFPFLMGQLIYNTHACTIVATALFPLPVFLIVV